MADFWSNSDRGYRLNLSVTQSSSSQVRVRLTLHNTYTTFAEYNCSAYTVVGGRRLDWSGRPSMLSHNSSIVLIDDTVSVSDRSVSLSASFSGSGGWSPGTLSISGNSFTMAGSSSSSDSNTDILHGTYYAYTPGSIVSSVSAVTGTIGSSLSIAIDRVNQYVTHTIRYSWAEKSGTIATGVGTSYDWVVPIDFANDIPNTMSGTGTIYVDSYVNGTKIGTKQATCTLSVPATMKPTFSTVTLSDTNGTVRNLLSGNNFLQIISDIQVTFNGAVGTYGSTITGYRAEIVNRNQVTASNGGRLGMMNFTGSATIRAYVVDSRGRQSEPKDVTINVIAYFAPILSFTAVRTRETPSIIQVVRNARIAPIPLSGNQKNTMSLRFKVAPLGSNSFVTDTGSASGSWTSISSLINSSANLGGTYPANKSFIIIGVLSDKFTTTEFSVIVATESVVMSYDKDGRVGIGKVAERGRSGSLDVAGDIYGHDSFLTGEYLSQGGSPVTFYAQTRVSDMNQALTAGIYCFDNNTLNQPHNERGYGVLEVVVSWGKEHNNRTNWIWQFYRNTVGKVFTRYKVNSGAWQPWLVPGLNQYYPIGSIFSTTVNTNPTALMGGTWSALATVDGVFRWKRTG